TTLFRSKVIRGGKRDGLAPVVPRRGDYYGPSVPRVLNGRFGRRVSLSTAETQIQEIAPGGEGAVDRFGDRKVRGARLGILRCGLRKHAEAVESSTRGDATDPGRRCSSRGDDPCAMRSEERRVGKECRSRWWQN